MTDLSGQYWSRYHLLEQLGEGGMATVYKAFDTRLERDVAIKVIRGDAFHPESLDEILKRFEREAKSLARLAHANIVKVYDYGEHEGAPFLVMEYLPGGNLKKLLGKPIAWKDALRYLLPIARGLAYAHQHGILHRDIKPANILITESGEPMLTDFGIAKMFEGEQQPALTLSGMIVGTPEYMAPEQWTGKVGRQSDMYSLGIVLYELVTGRKPYVADTPGAVLLKQSSEPLPRPSQFVGNLPDAVEKMLLKLLSKDPTDRYETMDALVDAMENLLGTTEDSTKAESSSLSIEENTPGMTSKESYLPPEGQIPVKSGWRPKRLFVAGGIAFVCLCLSLLAVYFLCILFSTPISNTEEVSTYPAQSPSPGAIDEIVPATIDVDPCEGMTDPGARLKFDFDQAVTCLNDIDRVRTFMANNIRYDPEYDIRERGGNEYVPARMVYEHGIDDADGCAILQCYFLEVNGRDAFMIGLSVESPVGSNVCGIKNEDGTILVLEGAGQAAGPFKSFTDLAGYYIERKWMLSGGSLRTLKASQVAQITTDFTTPTVLELPWVFQKY